MNRRLIINVTIDQMVDIDDEYTLETLNNYLKDCTNEAIKDSLADLLGLDDDLIKVESCYR